MREINIKSLNTIENIEYNFCLLDRRNFVFEKLDLQDTEVTNTVGLERLLFDLNGLYVRISVEYETTLTMRRKYLIPDRFDIQNLSIDRSDTVHLKFNRSDSDNLGVITISQKLGSIPTTTRTRSRPSRLFRIR